MSTPVSRKSNEALGKLGYTSTGRDRKGGEAARAELDRRVANGSRFAGKYIPARKATAAVAPTASSRVSEAQVDDMLTQARKMATAIARSEALLATGGGKGFQTVFFAARKRLFAEVLVNPHSFLD
jgi:hypothetical protein